MIIWIVLLGGIGSLFRFSVDGLVRTMLGRKFPWGTLFINVSGSFLLGLLTAYSLKSGNVDVRLILGVGFCGGFTTFSTASFEAVRLLQEHRYTAGLLQIAANAGLSLIAAYVGLMIIL